MLIVRAFISLGLTNVWGTFLGDEVAVLSQETVEERPSAIASFIHIVAGHEVLGGEFWHFFAVFDLHSVFRDLGERHSVARSAVALISVLIHEIISANGSPVVILWQLRVGD